MVVIGKTGRSIPVESAMDHVFGYCLANDISQRDLQRRHGGQWLKGKSIDRSMPLGPWITLRDDVVAPVDARKRKLVFRSSTSRAAAANRIVPPRLLAGLRSVTCGAISIWRQVTRAACWPPRAPRTAATSPSPRASRRRRRAAHVGAAAHPAQIAGRCQADSRDHDRDRLRPPNRAPAGWH